MKQEILLRGAHAARVLLSAARRKLFLGHLAQAKFMMTSRDPQHASGVRSPA